MIKLFFVIVFIFNISACNPVQKASQKKSTQPQNSFVCLASQSACEVITDLGIFTIQFSAQADKGKVKTELPFKVEVNFAPLTQSAKLKSVDSYLEGKTMFMGKIPVFFKFTNKSRDSIIAETLLASCSEEVMAWRLWFTADIEHGDKIIQENFFIDFDSQRL